MRCKYCGQMVAKNKAEILKEKKKTENLVPEFKRMYGVDDIICERPGKFPIIITAIGKERFLGIDVWSNKLCESTFNINKEYFPFKEKT